MAKRVGPTPKAQSKGFRRQIPPWATVLVIVLVIVAVVLVMRRTGIGGIGQMRPSTPEIKANIDKAPFELPGSLPPYSPDVVKKLKPSADYTPESEKYKPK